MMSHVCSPNRWYASKDVRAVKPLARRDELHLRGRGLRLHSAGQHTSTPKDTSVPASTSGAIGSRTTL
jgi:hypothetical protein